MTCTTVLMQENLNVFEYRALGEDNREAEQ